MNAGWYDNARAYADAHGYESRVGGWIYAKDSPEPLAHGWWRFANKFAAEIAAWIESR